MPNRYLKILLSVLAVTALSALKANAQLYYCVKAGTELTPSTEIMLVYVSGNQCLVAADKASLISSKLYSDRYYWRSLMSQKLSDTKEPYVYDSSLSTTSYKVYKSKWRGNPQMIWDPGAFSARWTNGSLMGFHYRAISNDGKTIISWRQRENSQEVLDKIYYEIVSPDELNKNPHDFLK